MSSKINIVRIAHDRQSCIDNNNIKYKIKSILRNPESFNVCVRKYSGNKYNSNLIIVYKPHNKVINSIAKPKNNTIIETTKIYNNNNKISCNKFNLTFIIEDRGSAFEIINKIVNKAACSLDVCIECTYIKSGGIGNLLEVINYIILRKNSTCIVMYDSGLKDINTLTKVKTVIEILNKMPTFKCIAFSPLCIEQCALTFKGLEIDIRGLNRDHLDLLEAATNYLKSGDISEFIDYDIQTGTYTVCGKSILSNNNIGGIKKYQNTNTIERYLANELAKITENRPYSFNKRANQCWYTNCECTGYKCTYEKTLGSKRKNSPVEFCNKTYINKEKIEAIIMESMFGIIYEIILWVICKRAFNIVHKNIIKEYVWR